MALFECNRLGHAAQFTISFKEIGLVIERGIQGRGRHWLHHLGDERGHGPTPLKPDSTADNLDKKIWYEDYREEKGESKQLGNSNPWPTHL